MGSHAYATGSDIHIGPGAERHLPHEAWHVVQQAGVRGGDPVHAPAPARPPIEPVHEQEADEDEAFEMPSAARQAGADLFKDRF